MSKEYMQAFRDILGILSAVSGCEVDMNSERIITVKSALQRLEAIDNANPSEALECLEQFLNEMTRCLENPKEYVKGYEKQIFWKYKNTLETTIKQALIKAEKVHKALEIIKEKKVEMALFNDSKTVEDYNHNRNWGANELTEEEYDLLKEVLDSE